MIKAPRSTSVQQRVHTRTRLYTARHQSAIETTREWQHMVLRRTRSAPANLSGASSPREGVTPVNRGVYIGDQDPQLDERVVQKGAIGEVVSAVGDGIQQTDPTEQLFFYLLIRWFIVHNREDLSRQLQNGALRLATSFLTHQVAAWVMEQVHNTSSSGAIS